MAYGGDIGGTAPDYRAGRAVELLTTGTDIGVENLYRFAAVGAPGADTNQNTGGTVRIVEVSVSSGQPQLSSTMNQYLAPGMSAPARQFGRSLLGVDLRECHAGSSIGALDGCGEELMVGNPDVGWHVSRGEVHVYEPLGAGNGAFAWSFTIPAPTSFPIGSEHGYSLAAPVPAPSAAAPWNVSPGYPPHVAIGAPGSNQVQIRKVDPTVAYPVYWSSVRAGPEAGRRFGHAITFGDFDGDSLPDLAVGAPSPFGSAIEGRVYVYRGTGTWPYLSTAPTVLNGFALTGTTTGGVQQDGFGTSLAAMRSVPDRDYLVVGAPTFDAPTSSGTAIDAGAICTFRFDSGMVLVEQRCTPNPYVPEGTAEGDRFGSSLAAANFVPADDRGRTFTEEAEAWEVAVGLPGWSADEGRVVLMLTAGGWPREDRLAAELRLEPLPAVGATFGAAMTVGYMQESLWPDLLVGAPEWSSSGTVWGRSEVTKSGSASVCSEATGFYQTTDSGGDIVDVLVAASTDGTATKITFQGEYLGRLRTNFGSGELCEPADGFVGPKTANFLIADGFELILPGGTIPCTGSITFSDLDAEPLLEALIGAGAGTGFSGAAALAWLENFMNDHPDQTYDVELPFDSSTTPATLSVDLDLDDIAWDALADFTDTFDEASWAPDCRPERLPWILIGGPPLCDP
jgi:hypothetical protein